MLHWKIREKIIGSEEDKDKIIKEIEQEIVGKLFLCKSCREKNSEILEELNLF